MNNCYRARFSHKNRWQSYVLFTLIILLFSIPSITSGQGIIPTKGKEFWLGFMLNYQQSANNKRLEVFITSDKNTSGIVLIPKQGWSLPFTVTANQTTSILIPNNIAEHIVSEVVENKGVYIATLDTVSVFAINFASYTADGSKILPFQSLGTEYRVLGYPGTINGGFAEFLIVSTTDDTEIRITPTAQTSGGKAAGVPFNITLDAGESYQVKATNSTGDFSGTTIVGTDSSGSCRPFAVFSGTTCVNIPNTGCPWCDHLFDQEITSEVWGSSYFAVPFTPASDYTIRILADQNNTQYTINGTTTGNLNAGQFFQISNNTTPMHITATKPVNVAQFMQGRSCSGTGDPAMVHLNAADQSIDNITFSTVTSTVISQHRLNVIMPTAFTSQLKLDGATVPASSFSLFPSNPAESYAQFTLTQGSHTLEADSGFSAYVYGTGQDESYAYSVGSYSKTQPIQIDSILCTNDTINIGINNQLYGSWWSVNSAPLDTIALGPVLTLVPPIIPELYILHGFENISGCEKEYYFSIELPDPPVVTITQSADTICPFENVQLTASTIPVSSNYIYSWSPVIGLSNPNIANPVATPFQSMWYFLSVSSPSGCSGIVRDSVYIEVLDGDVVNYNAFADDSLLCLGDSAQLQVILDKIIFHDSFDPVINPAIWSNVTGSANNLCTALNGNSLHFNNAGIRQAVTTDINVASGGTIKFGIRFPVGFAPCDDAEAGEDVVLSYSINGGGTWTSIMTCYEFAYPNFTIVTVAIPPAAHTTATRFKWQQISHSGVNNDNWMLDEVIIGATGYSGYVVNWSPPTGLSAINIPDPIADPQINTTYIVTISDTTTGCVYVDSVQIKVGQPFTLTTTPDTSLCNSTSVVVSSVPNIPGNYNYIWTPASGLSNPFSQSTNANPGYTSMYYISVSSAEGCNRTDSVKINVSNLSGIILSPSSASVCTGDSILATTTVIRQCGSNGTPISGVAQSSVPVNGTNSSSASGLTPFATSFRSSKHQYLILASELNSTGMMPGSSINEVGFYISSLAGNNLLENVSIKLGCTGLSQLTATFVDGLNQVYNAASVNLTTGRNGFTFNNTFDWDGYSNLIVEFCYNNSLSSTSKQVYYSGPMNGTVIYKGSSADVCSDLTGQVYSYRPKTDFIYYTNALSPSYSFNWSPQSGVSDPNSLNTYITPSVSTNYILTLIDTLTGCVYTDTTQINVAPGFSISVSSDTTICANDSITLFASHTGGAGSTTWWTPSNAFNDSTLLNPTILASPGTVFQFHVTSALGCSKKDSTQILINDLQSILIDPDILFMCPDDTVHTSLETETLCAIGNINCTGPVATASIGNSTTSSSSSQTTIFPGSYNSTRRQLLYRVGELTSQGMNDKSTISEISFTITSLGTPNYSDFTIKIGCESATQLSPVFITNLQTVFEPKNITLVNGINTFVFDHTYNWDGASSLVIEFCYENSASANSSAVQYHNPGFNTTLYRTGTTGMCSILNGWNSYYRPNIKFGYCQRDPLQHLVYQWTPTTGVTDPTIQDPGFYPDSSTTYFLTATDTISGCMFTDSVTVTINTSNLAVTAMNDTSVCNAIGTQLTAIHNSPGPVTYSWSPASNLSNPSAANPVITVAGTQLYVVSVTDSIGCFTVYDSVMVTESLPAVITLTPDTSVCLGDSISLQANGGLLYSWSPPSTLSNPLSSSTYAQPIVPTTYMLTVTDSSGCIITDSVTVGVDLLPVFTLGPDTSFCEGLSVTLNAGSGYLQYNWNTNTTGSTLTTDTSGTYWVDISNQCGTSRDSVIVTVFAAPVVDLGADTTLCNGIPVTLDPNIANGSYLWSNNATSQNIQVTLSGTYTITVTNLNGCTGSDSISVNFNTAPVVTLGIDTTICQGDSVLLYAYNAGCSYTWSTGAVNPSLTVWQAGTYWVVVDNGSCITSDTITLNVNLAPIVDLGPDITYCAGTPVTIDAGNSGMNFSWNTGQNTQTLQTSTPGIYSVTVSDSIGCSATDSIILNQLNLPVVELGNDTTICDYASITLDAGNSGSQYQWSEGSTTQTISTSDPGQIIVSVTDSNGCVSSDSINVFNYIVTEPELGNDTTICDGSSVLITVNGSFASYMWSTGSTAAAININTSGTYSVMVTDMNGCESADSIGVTTQPLPVINVNPVSPICLGDSVLLAASSSTAIQYQWSPINGLGNPQSSTTMASPAVLTNYSVTGTDTLGCTNTAGASVQLLYLHSFQLGNDTAFCLGNTIVLDAGAGNAAYLWSNGSTNQQITVSSAGTYWVGVTNVCGTVYDTLSVTEIYSLPVIDLGPGGKICTEPTPVLDAGNPGSIYQWSTGENTQAIYIHESGAYTVTVTNVNNCTSDAFISIELVNKPLVYLGQDTILCYGDELTLGAENQFATYLWNNGSTLPFITIAEAGSYFLYSENMCGADVDTIIIEYSDCICELYIPNAFTPNRDGINEIFRPESVCQLVNYQLLVYNRWGQLVFSSNEFVNGWDGIFNGDNAPQGVYIYNLAYTAELNGRITVKSHSGTVSLIR